MLLLLLRLYEGSLAFDQFGSGTGLLVQSEPSVAKQSKHSKLLYSAVQKQQHLKAKQQYIKYKMRSKYTQQQ